MIRLAPLDAYALAKAIAELATDAALRARLGLRSRTLAEAYPVQAMVQRYEALFAAVVG